MLWSPPGMPWLSIPLVAEDPVASSSAPPAAEPEEVEGSESSEELIRDFQAANGWTLRLTGRLSR